MFIDVRNRIHPNMIKTAMLLISERKFGSTSSIVKSLKGLKLNEDSEVFSEVSQMLLSQGVSENAIAELFKDSSSLILSLDNPVHIIGEYVYSSEVVEDTRRKIRSFNNNKNSFDINAILNPFKEFINRYCVNSYDWNSDGLKSFLGNAYAAYFSKDKRHSKVILEVLNSRGTVVNGAEGEMSLTDTIGFSSDRKNLYSIDFPSIVKDIYIASEKLFNISDKVVYDLFSFYREERLKTDINKVKKLFHSNFGSLELSPTLVGKKTSYSTPYTENTVNIRSLMLRRIYNVLENGALINNATSLYEDIKAIDYDTISSVNVATLFKYPKSSTSYVKIEAMEKHNKELFLDILKGVVSLRKFIEYITLNEIEFSDFRLFRDKSNYKRFSTLESYISFNELSKSLIEESNKMEVVLPYYENDKLYAVLGTRYNLSCLSSIYDEHFNKIYSEKDSIDSFVERLEVLISVNLESVREIKSCIEDLKGIDVDPKSEASFEYIASQTDFVNSFSSYFIENTTSYFLKDILLEDKDIYNILRFFEFGLRVFDHLLVMLKLSTMSNDKLMFSDKLHFLDFPKSIIEVEDISRIKSDRFPLTFYSDKLNPYMEDDYKSSKFYSSLFGIIQIYIDDICEYCRSWISKFNSTLELYGIIMVEEVKFNSIKLRAKLTILKNTEENLPRNFLEFASKFRDVEGLLSENGVPIVYERYLVSSKGYFLATFDNFSIQKITEMQTFDLSKVQPWRGVLWKV